MTSTSRWARRPEGDPRHDLGRAGEAVVAAAYVAQGFAVVATNLRTKAGELDLVVRRGRLLVAVEVKTTRSHPAPERLVTDAELARREAALRAVARLFVPRGKARLRVDVAAVRWTLESGPELRTFPGELLP